MVPLKFCFPLISVLLSNKYIYLMERVGGKDRWNGNIHREIANKPGLLLLTSQVSFSK